MNIKQALKYKNKLTKKINEAYAKVATYNSVEEGQLRPYDVEDSLDEYFKLTTELIELKTKIHTANHVVYGKIFEMSELKSQISKLKELDCSEGKTKDKYRFSESASVDKTSVISVVERDAMINKLEELVEKIQDELDVHNATTHI